MAIAEDIERTLMKLPEVQSIVTNLGRPELATEIMGLYEGDVFVTFRRGQKPKADSIDEFIERMDDALNDIPGVAYSFSAPMAMRLEETISGVRTELGVKVFGDDLRCSSSKPQTSPQSSRRFGVRPMLRLASVPVRCRSK